jgi:cupin fold WbuC family metalloprotein
MKIISNQLLTEVSAQAKASVRKRQNYNFHETLDAVVQRMLNAMEPGTYVQPHKHENPDKMEAFIVLRGKALVVEFDDHGNITTYSVIVAGGDLYGVEIQPRTWHCIVALVAGTVVYEAKEGPYSPLNDKNFATWAPKEGDANCGEYIAGLLKKCGL